MQTRFVAFLAAVAGASLLGAPAIARATAATPDLRVDFLVEPPSQLPVGERFSTAVVVRNAGAATAAGARTRFFLTRNPRTRTVDAPLGNRSSPRLAAGHTSLKAIRFAIPATTPSGEYFLVACADSTNRVRESRESNNCMSSAESLQVTQ